MGKGRRRGEVGGNLEGGTLVDRAMADGVLMCVFSHCR